jgi:branched-chain amino acid transport system permease protein
MKKALPWVLLALALIAPTFLYSLMLVNVLCFAITAMGYNLLVGNTRLISFGHTAYVGTAAYATGYLLTAQGWPTEAGILAGVLAATLLGLVFGLLAIRRQGLYFGMITLAQAQLVYFLYMNASFTGGENGLQGVPRGKLFGALDLSNDLVLYYVVLVVFAAVLLFTWRVVRSPFGHVLQGIRENEARAISMGFDTDRYKLLVFVISSAIAGLAGSLKTLSFGLATLTDVHWSAAADMLVMVLVGGIGTLWGPVIGAALVVFLHTYLAEVAPALVYGIMGVVFIVCVLVFRRGIVGELQARWLSRRQRAQPAPDTPAANKPGHAPQPLKSAVH